jgi:predicted ABC-type transport system involved in lysophospholipase L1 biosynthesis ATPase subunit
VGGANTDYLVKGADLPRPGESLDGEVFQEAPGGKGANQAVAAARLGARVALVGRVGDDRRGQEMANRLAAEGVETRFVVRDRDAATGVAVIMVDHGGHKQILTALGANHRLTPEDVRAAEAALRQAKVVLAQQEVPPEPVALALQLGRQAGARTVLDPAPARPLLVRDLSLEAPEGERVAITGPNRAGKALLLATAGLWQDGQGRLIRPGPGEVMFVPQRPYAASGRLRDILRDGLGQEVPDDRLQTVLTEVGLEGVLARAGGLEAEQDWAEVLSAGELQALTFARLLLASPRFAFLDDPARIIEAPLAEHLYQVLARSPITYVSAGCPPALLAYHDRRVELRDDGSWRLLWRL